MSREDGKHGDARLRRERDLYRRLLDLATEREIGPFLEQALAVLVDAVGAAQGYLEVFDDDCDAVQWSTAHGFDAENLEDVRAAISTGIVAEAVATGKVVVTVSALADPRFERRESVVRGRIESVLCAPVGTDPPRGALYLQGNCEPTGFTRADIDLVELCATHLAAHVDRLLARHVRRVDATQDVRRVLRADGVIGHSLALGDTLRQIAAVAPLETTVLLTGESGTGKSQLGRVLHDNSSRARGPFVEVNCAAIPESLVESELFGALPGAHSTATRRMEGKVSAAERGTLLLDEIGELTLPAQAKLLQLLQSKTYYPLGATTPSVANARLIAATNQDLREKVADRTFREDLLYRLEVVPIRVPSLRERSEDVAELTELFLAEACKRDRLPRLRLSPRALRAIESAPWPGNVRQLAHAVEAAAIRAVADGAEEVDLVHVFTDSQSSTGTPASKPTFQEATRAFQADLLLGVLRESDWNVTETSRRLDLARSHVYNLVRAFGLKREVE
jgi:Nif-specific regulatory protein